MKYEVSFYGFNGMHREIEAIMDGLGGGSNVHTRKRAKYIARRAFDALIETIGAYHPDYVIEAPLHRNGAHSAIVRDCVGGYPHVVMVWARKLE